jgi:hypothetical protein
VENFANGLDLRRSPDTAPPGSLRVLRNAFINEGGEIEKAKAFYRHPELTAYGQTANYKGRITGPHRIEVATLGFAYLYRHRHNSLPTSGWTAGGGGVAASRSAGVSAGYPVTIWAMKSTNAMVDYDTLFHAPSVAHFGTETHIIERFEPTVASSVDVQHFEIAHDSAGQPTGETVITANNNRRAFMMLRDKLYVDLYRQVAASAVGNPGDMAGTGSGIFDTRTQSYPIGLIVGFGEYFGQLVVIGTRGAQFWSVDPDFAKNQYDRTIPLSALAPRAIIGYGDGDVAYLGRDGVRSLRARDSSNIAAVADFGSPIDRLIRGELAEGGVFTETTNGTARRSDLYYHLPIMQIHPSTGALWLFLKDKIWVYTNYPAAGVRAWSQFDLPTPDPANVSARAGTLKSRWAADACQFVDDIAFRNFADETYIYGGLDGAAYDSSMCEVVTPHMDMGKPGAEKDLAGVDLSCLGTWTIQVSLDPTNVVWETIATVTNSTFRLTGILPIDLKASHIALRLTSTSASLARIGQIVLYYDEGAKK